VVAVVIGLIKQALVVIILRMAIIARRVTIRQDIDVKAYTRRIKPVIVGTIKVVVTATIYWAITTAVTKASVDTASFVIIIFPSVAIAPW
jgi:hypothetical protein